MEEQTEVEELEKQGFITYLKTLQENTARLPINFIKIYNGILKIIPDQIYNYFDADEIGYGSWEKFNALFEMLRNNFLIEIDKTNPTLSELYPGSFGSAQTKNLKVHLKKLEFYCTFSQYPLTLAITDKDTSSLIEPEKETAMVLNAKNAPFADFFCYRDNIAFCGQTKWDYNSEKFKLAQLLEEHDKNSTGLAKSNTRVITILFTTQPIDFKESDIPDDCLVICQENFKRYYGPFAECFAFRVAQKISVNCADQQHLESITLIGTQNAKKIILNRPWRNKAQLEKEFGKATFKSLMKSTTTFPYGDEWDES